MTTKQCAFVCRVSLEFGVITVVAGFLGVFLGAEGARWYRRYNKQADPLICAFGLLSSVPFLFFALTLAKISPPATWVSASFCLFMLG